MSTVEKMYRYPDNVQTKVFMGTLYTAYHLADAFGDIDSISVMFPHAQTYILLQPTEDGLRAPRVLRLAELDLPPPRHHHAPGGRPQPGGHGRGHERPRGRQGDRAGRGREVRGVLQEGAALLQGLQGKLSRNGREGRLQTGVKLMHLFFIDNVFSNEIKMFL